MGLSTGLKDPSVIGTAGSKGAVNRIGLGGGENVMSDNGQTVGQNAAENSQNLGSYLDGVKAKKRQQIGVGMAKMGHQLQASDQPVRGGGNPMPIQTPPPPQLPQLDYSLGLMRKRPMLDDQDQQYPFFGSY